MNAERLLAHYERIADTPAAIPRFRRLVLDLAVRGQIVEQDPNDESVSELLQQIAMGKMRLVQAGKIRKPRDLGGDEALLAPFEIPAGWHLVRLDCVGAIVAGGTPSASDPANFADPGTGVPWLTPADVGSFSKLFISRGARDLSETGLKSSSATLMPAGTVLFTSRAPIGYVAISANPISTNQGFKSIVPYISDCSRFIAVAMKAFAPAIDANASGTTFKEVSGKAVAGVPLPLPPLAEQHRIVAKVDELMALCDRLEIARTERETTRNRLAAASLTRLNAPDPNSTAFQRHVTFALENLTHLTTRPDQIKSLRQTILNLAIRGKLVVQDPKDKPASALLERIASARARLVKTGEIKKDKRRQPIAEAQGNFRIPPSWSWCRLGSLSKIVTSGSRDWAKYYSSEGAVFVRMGNLSKDHYRLRLDRIQRVKAPSGGEGSRTRLEDGDLLISITGDVGMLGLIPKNFGEAYINQHTAMVRPMDEMKGRYLPELFRSPFAQQQFNAPQRGIKNSFRLTDITDFLVPLPPLAEQHRIVAVVSQIVS
ncbi:MAG: restriction endonuclease subunit S [Thiotrichales bacterium]|nr:restriction endonuclease subunit S [Thiotrichales bacterium]